MQAAERIQRINWTLLCIGLAMLPHVTRLPGWITVFVLTVGLWRWQAERRAWPLPPRFLRLLVAATGFVGIVLSYRTINGLSAGTALLTIMMGMKLMETRARRDQLVLLLLSYFLVLASVLNNQSIWTGAYLIVTVWIITAGVLSIGKDGPALRARQGLRLSGKMLLQAVPLMLVLFFFFPRISQPFWSIPAGGGATTGLSDEMSPGEISDLTLSPDIAFRAKFEDEIPEPELLYWRGPVLSQFDGMRWSRLQAPLADDEDLEFLGESFNYRVSLQPHQRRWIFALDLPSSWDGRLVRMNSDLQLIGQRPVNRLLAYNATSYLDYRADVDLMPLIERRNLAYPDQRNRRTQELAIDMRDQAGSDEQYVSDVLQMFTEQEFFYTLQPPRTDFFDSVDDFLFETRQGFCGHFASSFTLMMRAAGIPSRVVTGYQGGEYNPVGDFVVVRQADAHAWSEVWLPGQGWRRVDPTAAVAPERIEQGLAMALPLSQSVQDQFFNSHPALQSLRFAWDAMHNTWNDWVIDFDLGKQYQILEKIGFDEPSWRSLAVALAIGLTAGLFFLALMTARGARRRIVDPAEKAWHRVCRKLSRRGLIRKPQEGALSFGRRVIATRPDLRTTLNEIVTTYLSLRYYRNSEPAQLKSLRTMARRFRP